MKLVPFETLNENKQFPYTYIQDFSHTISRDYVVSILIWIKMLEY